MANEHTNVCVCVNKAHHIGTRMTSSTEATSDVSIGAGDEVKQEIPPGCGRLSEGWIQK